MSKTEGNGCLENLIALIGAIALALAVYMVLVLREALK